MSDLSPLDPQGELDILDTAEDSWMPRMLIDSQEELARLGLLELGRRMGNLVIAEAVRRPGVTPKKILARLLADYPLDDEVWHERVFPELRRLLRGRGLEFDERGNLVEGEPGGEEAEA